MERGRLTPDRLFPSRLDSSTSVHLKISGHFALKQCHPVKRGTSHAYGLPPIPCLERKKEAGRESGQPQEVAGRSFLFARPSPGSCHGLPLTACYYFFAAAFLPGCFSARGLRTWGLTAVSSTGVVLLTSFEKVAPLGTR